MLLLAKGCHGDDSNCVALWGKSVDAATEVLPSKNGWSAVIRTNAAVNREPSSSARGVKLSLQGVTYRYGGLAAVDDVSLDIGTGQFVSILGPSGCGKTTLLSMIAGLRRPHAGRIFLDGTDITRLAPEKRALGMVFQNLALFPHLSVEENVAFSLAVNRTSRDERSERASQALRTVGLSGYERRSVNQLSGGQQQRVALARSLITEPKVLLLDEPLGALDAAIRREMQTELKALQRRLNITFIFVTHDQGEAMSMSDRIILMNQGKVVQDAAPFDAYTRPATSFAAAFMGDTNLLEASLISVSAQECLVAIGALQMTLRMPAPTGARIGDTLRLSLRPEHFTVVTDSAADGAIPGKVVAQRFYGPEVLLDIDTDLGLLRIRQAAGPRLAADLVGTTLHLRPDTTRAQLFIANDPEPKSEITEERS